MYPKSTFETKKYNIVKGIISIWYKSCKLILYDFYIKLGVDNLSISFWIEHEMSLLG